MSLEHLDKVMNSIVLVKYTIYIGLFFGTSYIGMELANYVYYNVFNKVDSTYGATSFRIILVTIIEAILIGLVILGYNIFILKAKIFSLFLFTYFFMFILSLVGYINIYHEFPKFTLFWFWIEQFIYCSIWLLFIFIEKKG